MHSKIGLGLRATILTLGLLVPTSGALSGQDPKMTEVNPVDFGFAVEVPESFALAKGDAVVSVRYVTDGAELAESFALDIRPYGGAFPKARPTNQVFLGRLSPVDQARMARLQNAIAASQTSGAEGDGTVEIAIAGGCHTGARPEVLPMNSWMQIDPAEGYISISRSRDVFKLLDAEARRQLVANLRPCS